MSLEAPASRRLYAQIADQVAALILTGQYRPGEQLPSERELAGRLKVSRPTVREAMIALEVRGLVDIRVGVGMFVRSAPARQSAGPAPRTAQELIEARLLVEPQLAALAAERRSAADLKLLRKHLAQLGSAAERGGWSHRDDRALHQTVARAAGNRILADFLVALLADQDDAPAPGSEAPPARLTRTASQSFEDHCRVVEALERRDPAASRQAMHDQLASVQREMQADGAGEPG